MCLLFFGLSATSVLTPQIAGADSLKEANRLLRAAAVQHHFESARTDQTRAIIRTYRSIISMSAEVNLPPLITQRISDCYARVYAWENFEAGLAQILVDYLSDDEIGLLTDFYSNLGLPPTEIQAFKALIAKSNQIQQASLEYMTANSESCVEQDAEIILDYIATQHSPLATASINQ